MKGKHRVIVQNWKLILENAAGNIFFTDEENAFINTEEFAESVQGSTM